VLQRKLRPSIARVNLYNWTRVMQLYQTYHRSNQPHQAFTRKLSPDGAARARKHTYDTAYYSVYRPRKDETLIRPGWLVTYRNKVPPPGVEPGHVTHPSTNRARRRVTSLILPTLLALRHAATQCVRGQLSIPFPFVCLLNKKAARVEVNISLAFLHWVGIALNP